MLFLLFKIIPHFAFSEEVPVRWVWGVSIAAEGKKRSNDSNNQMCSQMCNFSLELIS